MTAATLVAAVAGCGSNTPRHPPQDRTAWIPLAPLARAPGASGAVDGASIVDVSGIPYVVVVDRAAEAGQSHATVYRETRIGWTEPGTITGLTVDRDAPVDVVGGPRLCVSALDEAQLRVRCLRGTRWQNMGGPVFVTSGEDTNAGALLTARGALVVLRNRRIQPSGRFETTAWRWSRTRGWRSFGGDVAPNYPGGSQRPYGVTTRHGLCVAYDGLPADRTYGPDIALSCMRAGRWRVVRRLPAPEARSAGEQGMRVVSGAAAEGDTVRVGVQLMGSAGGSWDLHAGGPSEWRRAVRSDPGPGWTAQGELFNLRGAVWAIRFDQASRGPGWSTLATRLVVLRERAGGFEQVGSPLRDADHFSGPVYFGLVRSGSRVLALATVPMPDGAADAVRVFELRGASSAPAAGS